VKIDNLKIYSGKLHFRKHLNLERIDSKNARKGRKKKKGQVDCPLFTSFSKSDGDKIDMRIKLSAVSI
jgi:hypothetical protein